MDKKTIGNWGEDVAKKYLENKGYKILATNWRYKHRELDLIVYKGNIIGVEVKTRNNSNYPAFTVLKMEQVTRLRQTLAKYCQINGFNYNYSRLDLILITKQNKQTIKLKHYHQI
ncbi:MAG: YraN family protein [Patescibacteria group bacterium]